ncbi:Polyketide cyclase / dehydrase and lipid transport [Planctomycetes bacterium Pla163]|uniref:Polyketide cyclase / dehydrase and lipid transport n=1 Tax=Rohdeia mirabilis TaxID=2528008 RepID=A0A518D4V9_9BACT|nr:Polyketide cyclase / dehydrase and lipid transport [Planctomycetes bacterium Pla163]
MPSLTVSRTIDAPVEKVFDVSTDVHIWADVVPAIQRVEVLTDGPVGLGTRFRETRTMFGRDATETMEFIEFERPNRYVLGAQSHGCRYRSIFTLTPDGGGTKLEMVFEGTPLTFGAKVMSVVMRPFMKKMGDMCAADLDAIKAHVES